MEFSGEDKNRQPPNQEVGATFDEMAVIKMMQQDIAAYGFVRPETSEQCMDEELTFVAEGINAPMVTRFTMDFTPHGLVNKRGKLLQQTLSHGLQAAERAASRDSRKQFHLKRFVHDFHEGELLEAMMSGETEENSLVSVSPFCDEAYIKFGKDLVEGEGFQPERRLGFIRVYNKLPNSKLEIISISVDNSDLDAFRWLLFNLGVDVPAETESDDFLAFRAHLDLSSLEQAALPQKVLTYYDQAMENIYGQKLKAGRPIRDEAEVWSFINSQTDLVNRYKQRLELLAREDPSNRRAKQELTIGFWAALKDRLKVYEKNGFLLARENNSVVVGNIALDREMAASYSRAQANYERLIGCGGILAADVNSDLADLSPAEALANLFSDQANTLVWKKGFCRIPGCPTTGKKTEVAQCSVCRKCQHLFDKGIDPARIYQSTAKVALAA